MAKRTRRREDRKKERRKLKGINGWLIFPMLGFMIGIIDILKNIVKNPENISLVIFGAVIIAFYVVTLVFLFQEKKQTILFAVISLWAGFAYTLISTYSTSGSVVADGTWVVIWTWYFNVSKRVKNTFVK